MTGGLQTLKMGLPLSKLFAFSDSNPKSTRRSQKSPQVASEHSSICQKDSAEADNTAPGAPPLNPLSAFGFEGHRRPRNRFLFQIWRFIRIPPSVGMANADKRSPESQRLFMKISGPKIRRADLEIARNQLETFRF
jgi:hypothetical protein